MKKPDPFEALTSDGGRYVDELYESYLDDPDSVDPSWVRLFDDPRFRGSSRSTRVKGNSNVDHTTLDAYDVVHTYREYGYLIADTDPLGQSPREHAFLELDEFGLNESDLELEARCDGYPGVTGRASLRDYIEALRETYCGHIGVEYMDLMHKDQRDWLQQRMEPTRNRSALSTTKQKHLLSQLIEAHTFESMIHSMYPGAKRFSLEGGTTLLLLLYEILERSADHGVEQIVLGMPHRGRLNVLAHIMKKPLEHILAEFEGRPMAAGLEGYGDVKYHMGYSLDRTAQNGHQLHLSLAYNPSHLEVVGPVVEGIVRAKQVQLNDHKRTKVVPVLLHGDAAFAGQGVVAETFCLSRLEGYTTGGTVHIIVNNQIGFTATPYETRSTAFASDIAKTVRAPVFHVNADDPEAVAFVGQLALDYRQRFASDIVIDLVCFRRHGHNETDDASFTQPVMARLIQGHPPTNVLYGRELIDEGVISPAEVELMVATERQRMRDARDRARELPEQVSHSLEGRWQGIEQSSDWDVSTAVDLEHLNLVAKALASTPPDFTAHPKLVSLMKRRSSSVLDDGAIDWGTGESLAIGSLLLEGTPIRLSGQDSQRGTYSHRHAVLHDYNNGDLFVPLNHLTAEQAKLEVINSPVSEEAVLGFEYGYSSADPWTLVIWEAQFGDFANGAQVIIDQLIASCEYKWARWSGIVLLLPHGQDGQGPEHSSARLERFLELCAENNMQVCNLTTPAQIFHALRAQMHRKFRKPLVIMSPKSLLRHPDAVSPIEDFAEGRFQPVLQDDDVDDPGAVKRVLFCSGKIYYPLAKMRTERGIKDVAIVRIERLYPFPLTEVHLAFARYRNMERVIWVQEEPRNQGAWRNLQYRFRQPLPDGVELEYAGRDSRATPATGAMGFHRHEEAELVDLALRAEPGPRLVRRKST